MPRPQRFLPLLSFVFLALCLLTPRAHGFGWPGSNDNMFPPAAAAKPYIDFDGRGFLIHGKRTFIVSGDLHYSRVPRALWRDRLLRIKRAGYNTVQTYAFWNYHEYKEGQFDFSGDRDLGAYLKLIHSLGMYAIVRIGPYVNAEWDSGGWPVWMRFKPGLIVRDNNRPYLYYLDRWLGHLMPIVSSNQINHGGSVIMVQLENEDSRGAGTDVPNPYFKHLQDKCLALGLQVPYFFSGLNHSDNPAGDTPFDISTRTSPWYSTEFWTGWIRFYGDDPERTRNRIRATWNVLANGGAGYTHYTIAGGTDFETWGCNEQAASYDFGAPIGQAGDLRPMYYGFKRAALFATSFPNILADAENATDKYQGVATGSGVSIAARTSPAGTIVFLKNDSGGNPVKTQIKDKAGKAYPTAGPLTLDANEIMPVVEDAPLAPGVTLALAAAHTLGMITQGSTTTLVIYGLPKDPAEIRFTIGAGQTATIVRRMGRG
jgi:beta-galactosidase